MNEWKQRFLSYIDQLNTGSDHTREAYERDIDDFIAFLAEEGVTSLVAKIKELNEKLEIPKSFQELGIEEQDFLANVDELADRAFEDQCTTANPRLPLVSELKQILLDAYYGK